MKDLLGLWMIDPASRPNQLVTIEFKENGQLIYTIVGEEKDDVILLTYRLENDMIITNQPSAPREEKTKFSITSEGKLILLYGNEVQQYVRVPNVQA